MSCSEKYLKSSVPVLHKPYAISQLLTLLRSKTISEERR
jgi:hypothetical protein